MTSALKVLECPEEGREPRLRFFRTSLLEMRFIMNLRSSLIRLSLSLALCIAWVSPAFADNALDYLKARHTELTTLVTDNAPEPKLTAAFDALLDYDALARNSLDAEWGKLTPVQQQEFKSLLTTLVQRAYTKNIKDTLNYSIEFKSENEAKSGKLVLTVAKHKTDPRKEPLTIDYIVAAQGGKWRVQDIITEGSSLVQNYRNQFRRIIDKQGFQGLIDKMKKKVTDG